MGSVAMAGFTVVEEISSTVEKTLPSSYTQYNQAERLQLLWECQDGRGGKQPWRGVVVGSVMQLYRRPGTNCRRSDWKLRINRPSRPRSSRHRMRGL